jgi:DNA-binding NtrC family response regulator
MSVKALKNRDSARPLEVLFADDETALRELMADELPQMGCRVTVCADGHTAVSAIERQHFDLLIVDLDMPGLGGIEVIQRLREHSPQTEAIVFTGKATRESAIAALRLGAFDYLEKPCTLVELRTRIERVRQKLDMSRQIKVLSHRLERAEGPVRMVGGHPRMREALELIRRVAPTQSNVLITGETGTGKELAARAIHDGSPRREEAFLAVNCGALPENLIESELFGHRKGAFTGADENRQGLFEVADGGTLFLDEIGELPRTLQSRLLRVLESGEIRRVGDTRPFRVDVRIVSATHRDLNAMVGQDLFRQDLLYRINTFEVRLPALRERSTDIAELALQLLTRHKGVASQTGTAFTDAAATALKLWHWPGNIRELANVIEYAAVLCDRLPVDVGHLPRYLTDPANPAAYGRTTPPTLVEIEEEAIRLAIDRNDGNKTAAAAELGISLRTFYNRWNALTQKAA